MTPSAREVEAAQRFLGCVNGEHSGVCLGDFPDDVACEALAAEFARLRSEAVEECIAIINAAREEGESDLRTVRERIRSLSATKEDS